MALGFWILDLGPWSLDFVELVALGMAFDEALQNLNMNDCLSGLALVRVLECVLPARRRVCLD